MKTTVDFLDAIKFKRGLTSDYALAPVMGITRAEVSRLRNCKSYLGTDTAIRVAELLEIEPAFVLACANTERSKSEAEKALWASIVERFGGLAASVVVGVSLFGSPAPAQASPSVSCEQFVLCKVVTAP